MNIKKALKRKNKLLNEIKTEFLKFLEYNSTTKGTVKQYSARDSKNNWEKNIEELIELKTKIHTANVPIFGKIFRLSELKSMISSLKSLDCTEGIPQRQRYDTVDQLERIVEINLIEKDRMIKEIETEIDEIQDFLDDWNLKTTI